MIKDSIAQRKTANRLDPQKQLSDILFNHSIFRASDWGKMKNEILLNNFMIILTVAAYCFVVAQLYYTPSQLRVCVVEWERVREREKA